MKIFKFILALIIQFTWGILQNIVGLLGYIILLSTSCKRYIYKNSIITVIPGGWGGVALGMFIFICEGCKGTSLDDDPINHEYGHTIQSMILGPLWFLIIGLPSGIWYNMDKYREKHGVDYYSLYTESWANKLGHAYNHSATEDPQ